MYCIRCGKQLQDGVKYCMFCGSPTAEGKKAQPVEEQDTASIPMDFFSSRMNVGQEDAFDITIPADFIPSAPTQPAEDFSVAVPQEQEPQDIEDEAYTRMISTAEWKEAYASEAADAEDEVPQQEESAAPEALETEETEKEADAIPEEMHAKVEAHADSPDMPPEPEDAACPDDTDDEASAAPAAPQDEAVEEIEISNIPNIPIPQDFITAGTEQDGQDDMAEDIAFRSNPVHRSVVYRQEEPEDDPEQLISKRGLIIVVLIVFALFAIAVGACVMALQGGEPEETGSGVSFSYEETAT
ncbi:MAG: zinc-ribbon domain-containing protein [Eubacteriales bacterium]|nr:zinc-ribbon domain-containing protein [Eubacteriales bacterium]